MLCAVEQGSRVQSRGHDGRTVVGEGGLGERRRGATGLVCMDNLLLTMREGLVEKERERERTWWGNGDTMDCELGG